MSEERTASLRVARSLVALFFVAVFVVLATVDAEDSLTALSRAVGRRRSGSIAEQLSPERVAVLRWALLVGTAALAGFAWRRPDVLSTAPRALAGALRSTLADVAQWFRAMPRFERRVWVALTVVVLAQRVADALVVPMHCDELRTYFETVSRGPFVALTVYRDSNNHIFHSLLSSVFVASPLPAPLDLRCVSILASAMVPIALGVTLRAAVGAVPALLGTAALLTLPPVAFYGASARGYALCLLAATLGMLATAHLVQRPQAVRARWLFVVSCGLGALTVPLHVYCVACLVLVRVGFALADRDVRTFVRAATDAALSGVVAAIGYAGAFLWSDLGALTNARYVRPRAVETLASRLPDYVGRMGSWMLGADFAWAAVPLLLITSALLLWRTSSADRRQRCLAAIAFAFAASVAVVPLAQRMLPPHRGWIYVCLAVSVCVALVAARLRSSGEVRPVLASLVVLIVMAAGVRSTLRSMQKNRIDGQLAGVDDWLVDNAVPDVYAASRFASLSLRYRSQDRAKSYALEVADTWHDPARAYARLGRVAPPSAIVSELTVPPPPSVAADYRLAHEVGDFGVWVRQP